MIFLKKKMDVKEIKTELWNNHVFLLFPACQTEIY